jgi:tRNA(Arg) A34 adenosine deaminase TadA
MTDKLIDEGFVKIYDTLINSLDKGYGGPFGAGVFINSKAVAIGTNEVLKTGDVSRHAEVVTISKATKKLSQLHIPDAVLLSSHFPCLMCYHTIKWAMIKKFYYIFSIEETERLFSFTGDRAFLENLSITQKSFDNDPSIEIIKYDSPVIREYFYGKLVENWNRKYREKLVAYDISQCKH